MNRFYAMISRMKYIDRWGLMNNTRTENISEHSLETAILAHALVNIANIRLGENLNADRAAVIGMFHDAGEIITGDMPTPIKYYNPSIKDAYKAVEKVAEDRLVSMLPDDLQDIYRPVISNEDEVLERYVKAADKISALIKCIEEVRMGNNEFQKAKESTEQAIGEIDPVIGNFADSYQYSDVYTGISFRAYRIYGGNHADAVPYSAEDTVAYCQMFGTSNAQEIADREDSLQTWRRRPLWVTVGGRTFAASLYGTPHNFSDSIVKNANATLKNNFVGQFCVHFVNSKTHDSSTSAAHVDYDNAKNGNFGHQSAIKYAYNHSISGTK